DMDAAAQAFSLLDTSASGFVDPGLLKHMLLQLPGIDKLDEADMQLIASLADSDGDGRMSLEDFMAIGSWVPEREPVTEGVKKALAVKAVDRAGANRSST
ncbi:EF-hand domain-containing protein, partial [Haematococcus lacustris]